MYLAGQIARTAAIYRIDEVVIYDEVSEPPTNNAQPRFSKPTDKKPSAHNSTTFFTTVLSYLETPQYLRKHLFPMSSDLRLVGLLNPLALPSHVAREDTCRWREGIAYARTRSRRSHPPDAIAPVAQPAPTRFVDVGQDRLVEVDRPLQPGKRVTVDMSASGTSYENAVGKYLFGSVVERSTPGESDGTYWGYAVRSASALSDVFSRSETAPKGYDLTIGTSERGTHISKSGRPSRSFALPDFSHLLIVFGGVHGLERSVKGDAKLEELGIGSQAEDGGSDVGDLFDFYLNTCPQQGSRTIRTEEAILISLAALQPFLNTSDS